MKQFHQSYAFCAILLAALLLSACGWTAGGNVAEATDPELTATPESPTPIDLKAVLSVPTTLPDGDSVKLEFTLTNHSGNGMYVLTWFTPLEGLGGEIFCVERDGQPIPYEGPLAARGSPTPDAYVFLDAGASVSATVDLSTAYDFSEPGEYTIAFISPRISHAARTEGEMAASVDDLGPVAMPSNQVSVTILEDL
jgi:peptidyl-Lys metalloendopeptidase